MTRKDYIAIAAALKAARDAYAPHWDANPLVSVREQTLTDGSMVYDVVSAPLPTEGYVIISAETERAAQAIADAINEGAVAVFGKTVQL